MAAERNLIMVHTPVKQALTDFTAVAERMALRAPDIETFIVTNGLRLPITRRRAARRPTVVFSPMPIRGFEAARGAVFQAQRLSKLEQYDGLIAAAVPTPVSQLVEPGASLDPEEWGPMVVVKPLRGNQGRGVVLVRTIDVATGLKTPALAQRFIDTGTFAESHRVMVVFGRAIYSITSRSLVPRRHVDPREAVVVPIASNAGGSDSRTLMLSFDNEVITLGRRAAAAFPQVPVLGVDIVRDVVTGGLWVLEVNPGGSTWHISSDYAAPQREKFGLDLHAQFGALDIIADALIDVTRREAV